MPYTSFQPVEVKTETVALKTVDVLVSVEVTNAHGGEEIIRGTFERRQLDPEGKTVRVKLGVDPTRPDMKFLAWSGWPETRNPTLLREFSSRFEAALYFETH
jgi:hypothetical protein